MRRKMAIVAFGVSLATCGCLILDLIFGFAEAGFYGLRERLLQIMGSGSQLDATSWWLVAWHLSLLALFTIATGVWWRRVQTSQ